MKRLQLLPVSVLLLCMAGVVQRAAFAQAQPPLGQTLQDHFCWKKRVCTGGALLGQCQPQGYLCLSGTCGDPGDGCSWSYNWACYESCEETCTHVRSPEREAWSGICAFRPDQWQDQKHRIPGVDTAASSMQSLAAAAGVIAAPLTNEVVRHSDGVVETTVEDGLTLYRKPVPAIVHPLVPLDISLAPWQDAIDLGATVKGQEIHGYADGEMHSITYANSLADGSWLATDYSFDANLDWAPRHVRSYDEEGTLVRIVFGYAPTAPEELMRPRAVAKGVVLEGGNVDATVWVIDEWDESCDPALVELREPALYLELDFMTDPYTPTATVREPDYLIGIEPCSRLQMAIDNVIEAYGTDDRETDYNYDGIVDWDDIEVVFEKFGSSGQ